jgi:hypothetical protein
VNWLDANADGLALMIVVGLLGIFALIAALIIERIAGAACRRGLHSDPTVTAHRRIEANARRVRAGIRSPR